MGMSKQQRDYAIERVNDLRRSTVYRIEQKHPKAPDTKSLSNDDRAQLVRSGKVKLFPPSKTRGIGGTLYVSELYDFGPIKAAAKKKADDISALIRKEIRKETGPVYNEATRIIDQIMLGDSAEALALIEGFAKMCKK